MSSNGALIAHGKVKGTGSAINIDTLGFQPKRISIINVTGLVKAHWQDGMAAASAWLEIDSGAGAVDFSVVTSNGITLRDEGFTIGANGDLNVAGEIMYYEAVGY